MQLNPNTQEMLGRAMLLEEAGQLGDAFNLFRAVTTLAPTCGRAWRHLGNLLRRSGDLGAASECFEKALASGDDAVLNNFFLSAIGVGPIVPSPPRDFVRSLFNQYAARFEQHLTNELQYRAPQLLFELMCGSAKRQFENGLDLGCGTGLTARAFKRAVTCMSGVDLSEQMLAVAEASGLYDRLTLSSLEDYLASPTQSFDLILCCDTFVYIGDLKSAFSGVRNTLSRGGSFGFTVELCQARTNFDLLPGLRYAHTEKYILQLARKYDFHLVALHKGVHREEAGEPVQGLAVHLVRT